MKAKFVLKGNTEPPSMEELVYDQGGTLVGGFTLLSSPDDIREYLFETSPVMIEKMKTTKGYEFVEYVDEIL